MPSKAPHADLEHPPSFVREVVGLTERDVLAKVYRVFEERLLVLSESPEMSEHIECFMRNLEMEFTEPTIRVALLSADGAGAGRKIQLCCPELDIARTERLGYDAWLAFRRLFMRLALDPSRPNYIMHASAVADEKGRAALVVGVSDSGKTSALIGLVREGLRMVCDDYSAMTFDEGRVVSLPVGVTVTERTFEWFPALRELARPTCQFMHRRQRQWTVNLSERFEVCPAFEEFEPTHFYFLFPNFGSGSSIDECDREWSQWWFQAGRILSHNMTPRFVSSALSYHEKCFALVQKMVGRAKFFKVMNGDIHETTSLIADSFRG